MTARKTLLALFVLAATLVTAGWAWAYAALRHLPTPAVLHFTNYSGIDRIGSVADLHRIGFLGAIILAVNGALALTLIERSPHVARLIAIATCFLALLLFILFAAIIGVN